MNFKRLLSYNVDGILFNPCGKDNKETRSIMNTMDIPPIVFMFTSLGMEDCYWVTSDDQEGAYSATKYLLSLGHKKIIFIKGGYGHYSEQQREAGFLKAMSEHGFAAGPDNVMVSSYHMDNTTFLLLDKLIDSGSEFSAVFCCNDIIAMDVIKVRNLHNLSFSVVGFDDITFSSYFDLTTVSVPCYELGKNAFLLLEDIMMNRARPREKIILKTSLVIRNSCKMFI